MRALVTGAAGFVGSHRAEGLREAQDHDVLATARLLEAVRRAPPRRFALASSSSVYGTCGPAPAVGLEEGLASQVAWHRGLGRAA